MFDVSFFPSFKHLVEGGVVCIPSLRFGRLSISLRKITKLVGIPSPSPPVLVLQFLGCVFSIQEIQALQAWQTKMGISDKSSQSNSTLEVGKFARNGFSLPFLEDQHKPNLKQW